MTGPTDDTAAAGVSQSRSCGPVPFLDLDAVNRSLEPMVRSTVQRVLQHGYSMSGPEGPAFERAYAAAAGVRHAIGTASRHDALVLAIRGLGLEPGAEIIVPANASLAAMQAILNCLCVPVLVEPSPLHLCLDPEQVAAALSPAARAVLAVHQHGRIAEWDRLESIARRHGLILIEDAGQAHGAEWNGRRAGSLGQAAAFGFSPDANLGALSDAGTVTTRDDAVASRIRRLRQGGGSGPDSCGAAGCSSCLDELQAAILLAKLPFLDAWNARRRALARRYLAGIRNPAVRLPQAADESAHVWHRFAIQSAQRDALAAYLSENGIGTMIDDAAPVHRQPAMAGLARSPLPLTERLARELLSLPLNPALTDGQADAIIACINRWSP